MNAHVLTQYRYDFEYLQSFCPMFLVIVCTASAEPTVTHRVFFEIEADNVCRTKRLMHRRQCLEVRGI
jgi:hypothetical protein